MFDGEGEVDWPQYLHEFISMLYEEDGCSDEHANLLLAHTLHESPCRWLLSLSADNVHSLKHFCDLIEDTLYHFDPDCLDRTLLQQWSAPHESVIIFGSAFMTCSFKLRRAR